MSDTPNQTPPEPHFLDGLTKNQEDNIRQLLAYCYVRGYSDSLADSSRVLHGIDPAKLANLLWNDVRVPPTKTEANPNCEVVDPLIHEVSPVKPSEVTEQSKDVSEQH